MTHETRVAEIPKLSKEENECQYPSSLFGGPSSVVPGRSTYEHVLGVELDSGHSESSMLRIRNDVDFGTTFR